MGNGRASATVSPAKSTRLRRFITATHFATGAHSRLVGSPVLALVHRPQIAAHLRKEVRVPVFAAVQIVGVLGASIVNISPNESSLPGSSELTSLAGGLEWVALLVALVGFVIGAAAWAIGSHSNNYQSAAAGRRAVLVSGAAALVIGAAPAVVNFLYSGGTAVKP
jgi:hypothetical protein